ncbi:MAG: PilZ domain-containing protein [Deltaproteobacteria bacterium]|nr:PilZ domain-containing protein [Deltaproteobacteria bacterium]
MHQYRPARVAASLPVELYTVPFLPPFRMRIENISTGGMFIRTSIGFHVGEILMAKTWLPNMDKPGLFISRVARSFMPGQDVLDEYSGLGLQFLHGNKWQRQKLAEFIRSQNTPESDSDAPSESRPVHHSQPLTDDASSGSLG